MVSLLFVFWYVLSSATVYLLASDLSVVRLAQHKSCGAPCDSANTVRIVSLVLLFIHILLITLARLFFNILHPPLNVPALGNCYSPEVAVTLSLIHHLAVSLDQDVDTNKELVAHGYSNLLAGFTGSVFVQFHSQPLMLH